MKLFHLFLEQTFAEYLLHAQHWVGHLMAEEKVTKGGNYYTMIGIITKKHISITVGM